MRRIAREALLQQQHSLNNSMLLDTHARPLARESGAPPAIAAGTSAAY